VPFRLRNIDSAETGELGSIGGAKCEQELKKGFLAKAFIVALTSNTTVIVSNNHGSDRYGRNVVDLEPDGVDVAYSGIKAGHLQHWPHDDNGNSLSAKPNWCNR